MQGCEHVDISYPTDALTPYSLDIEPTDPKCHHVTDLKMGAVEEMQRVLLGVVKRMRETQLSNSYMLLACDSLQENRLLSFQVVPYAIKSAWWIIGLLQVMWQQLVVLWRFTFGGLSLTSERADLLATTYADLTPEQRDVADRVNQCATCAFCRQEVIDSQLVLDGESVQVLYNYAPIGFGEEKLHFLVISKEHRPNFEALTPEEHQEAFEISQFVIQRLQQIFPLEKLYLYHKSGEEAGQTVPHWHMHLVFTQSVPQDLWGRVIVLRNILLGAIFSFQLSKSELREKQERFYTILNS